MKQQTVLCLGFLAILFLFHQSHAQTGGATATLFELLQQSERLQEKQQQQGLQQNILQHQQQQQQEPWMYQASPYPIPIYNRRTQTSYAYRQPMWLMYYWMLDNM